MYEIWDSLGLLGIFWEFLGLFGNKSVRESNSPLAKSKKLKSYSNRHQTKRTWCGIASTTCVSSNILKSSLYYESSVHVHFYCPREREDTQRHTSPLPDRNSQTHTHDHMHTQTESHRHTPHSHTHRQTHSHTNTQKRRYTLTHTFTKEASENWVHN